MAASAQLWQIMPEHVTNTEYPFCGVEKASVVRFAKKKNVMTVKKIIHI